MSTTVLDTAVIGAGAAGLHVAKLLSDRGIGFTVFDEHPRVGDSWRERYRSLQLFTPRPFVALPGLKPPVGAFSYPSAAQMADYLEQYARVFDLPVRTGSRVRSLERDASGRFRLLFGPGPGSGSGSGEADDVLADHVIVTAGAHRMPVVPAFAAEVATGIRQFHSTRYNGPEQFADGPVLVVGYGNSGSDIALEAVRAGHAVTIAGRIPGELPVRIDSPIANLVARRFLRRLTALTVDTAQGRAAMAAQAGHGIMLIRNKSTDLATAGVRHVGRIERILDGRPIADGAPVEASTIVWCTGSRPDVGWIDIDGVVENGEPVHERGIATACPRLGFVGLDFQYSAASSTLAGMGRDAREIVEALFAAERADAVVAGA
jgi:putative flavoprotein involved in K+ transport